MPKTKSKKVDIIQIEDQYNQSVAIYLKTLKNKLKSLEKWEFEKQLYQTKIKALVETNGDCLVATFVDGVDYIGSDNLSNIERNCNHWVDIFGTPYEKVKLNITRLRYYDLLEFAKYQLSQIEGVYDNSNNSLCCIVMITIVIFTILPIILIIQ